MCIGRTKRLLSRLSGAAHRQFHAELTHIEAISESVFEAIALLAQPTHSAAGVLYQDVFPCKILIKR